MRWLAVTLPRPGCSKNRGKQISFQQLGSSEEMRPGRGGLSVPRNAAAERDRCHRSLRRCTATCLRLCLLSGAASETFACLLCFWLEFVILCYFSVDLYTVQHHSFGPAETNATMSSALYTPWLAAAMRNKKNAAGHGPHSNRTSVQNIRRGGLFVTSGTTVQK